MNQAFNHSASSPAYDSLPLLNMRYCRYLESVRRFNYTTPKSYLELISLYKGLLEKKRSELRANKERLENGVDKISQASAQAGINFCQLLPIANQPANTKFDLCYMPWPHVLSMLQLLCKLFVVKLQALPMLKRPITD